MCLLFVTLPMWEKIYLKLNFYLTLDVLLFLYYRWTIMTFIYVYDIDYRSAIVKFKTNTYKICFKFWSKNRFILRYTLVIIFEKLLKD